MSNRLKRIYEKTSAKQALFIFLFFILFTSIVLPFVSSYTTSVIGVSESPDTSFNFHLDHLFSIVDSYGRSGRLFYVAMRWTFDVVWPITYTLFLLSSIGYLARRSHCKFTYKPLYIPLFAVLFDVLENINATIIMLLYPTRIDLFGYMLIVSSIIKWGMIGVSFLVVILLFVRLLIVKNKSI